MSIPLLVGKEVAPFYKGEILRARMASKLEQKVMVIDDDGVFVNLITHKFGLEDIPFVYAKSGDEALRILQGGEHPGVILLDISMPGLDGFEVLKKLKENPATAAIPVIMLSNFAQEKDIEWGKKLGAKRFIDKVSVVPTDIVDIVRNEMTSS